MSSTESTQVLVIGAGVAGLCASLFLADHGITSLVIERHSGTSIHPRARSVNARTMEFFRRIGIANRVREAGASIASSGGILQSNTLREAVEARKRKMTQGTPPLSGFLESTSPENGTFVTQDMLEPVLVEEARRRGIDIRFYTECIRVEQDPEGVTAVLESREDGERQSIRVAYLIAADGAKSPIRSQLHISSTGRGSMGHLLNILFEADLKELVHGREFSLLLVDRPEVTGLFTSIDNDKRWVFHLHFDPAKGQAPDDFPPEKCERLLEIAIGIPDLDIKVKTILPWEPAVMVAEKMQQGRIFLAGDAAHQMPPYAGQGANSGIADAHNLSWKIAAVLQGQAGADLLTTYETERWPVGKAAAEISAIGCDDRGLLPVTKNLTFFQSVWQKLFIVAGYGYGYASHAIIAEPTGPLNGWTWRPWTISSLLFSIDGRPGRRVPHVWVKKVGEKQSTLDICGNRFVILAGADGADWVRAAKAVSESMGVPIESYTVGPQGDLQAERGVFEAAAGLTSRGALLVRPDQFVAWRSRRTSSNPHVQIVDVMRQVMAIFGD